MLYILATSSVVEGDWAEVSQALGSIGKDAGLGHQGHIIMMLIQCRSAGIKKYVCSPKYDKL